MRSILLRRGAWALVVVYLFLSLIFFGLALTPDPSEPLGGGEYEPGRYGEITDASEPLTERYVAFLGWYTSLDLGESVIYRQPVTAVLAKALPVTLAYLLPALGLATVLSLGAGATAALDRGGVVDHLVGTLSQAGIAVPAVVVADLLAFAVGQSEWYPAFQESAELLAPANLAALALPALVVGGNLWAVQVLAVRGEATANVRQAFVRTFRASGARKRHLARHVLRNAAPSLLALFVSEALLTLVVSVYVVEVAFGLPGFGLISYRAFFKPDLALVVPAVILPILVGIVGTTVQDLVAATLDPRVEG